MTGADFKTAFEIRIDEVGSGFWDTTRLNGLVNSALIKLIDPKVEQYGLTKKITREMQPIISSSGPVVPVSGAIDISPTSITVVNFYSEVKVIVTSPYRSGSISRTATIKDLNDTISPYSTGTAEYPKYDIANNSMAIEPSDATSVTITYFIAPVDIDTADNTTPLPYNKKVLDLLIDLTMKAAGIADRDSNIEQIAAAEATQNP